MNNLLLAQSGGPTAAINATLAGVLEMAFKREEVDIVYGAVNGIQGVLEHHIIDMREKIKGEADLKKLCMTPAAALGSCRLKLKRMEEDESEYQKIIQFLQEKEIHYFIYIGGNDSMDTVHKLSLYCEKKGIKDIFITGAPKTIDNDLMGTDHSPGFGSAAKYIATTFAELERDCHVYSLKAVTIVEVMGRDTGWLTASSALSRMNGGKGPDLIYLCEVPFDMNHFIEDVRAKLKIADSVLIAVSEGIKNKEGFYLSQEMQSKTVDAFGHTIISGAARVMESCVRNEIGCKVRSVELNLMQRCAGHLRSGVDIEESKKLGELACKCAIEGQTGIMSAIIRESDAPYEIQYKAIPVDEVANKVRSVPRDYINKEGNDVTDKMLSYLYPLIQGEALVHFHHGIPDYFYF